MTGSMAYASQFNYNGASHNPDDMVPKFGHYVSVQSSLIASANQANGTGEAISRNNYCITTPGGLPIVRDFYLRSGQRRDSGDPGLSSRAGANGANLKNAFHRWSPPGDRRRTRPTTSR